MQNGDIAAGVQLHLETVMTAYITDMIKLYNPTGNVHLAVAGGVFANVKLNQVIAHIPEISQLFVYPHMGDGGLAVGAALALETAVKPHKTKKLTVPTDTVYFGDNILKSDITKVCSMYSQKIFVKKPQNLAFIVAELLSMAKTVAVVQGEMEYGPRALGHRSILYQATDPTVNEWLNKKLNRSEFMPFAPILKKENLSKLFSGWEKVERPLQFMTVTVTCNKQCRIEAPAIVHVDKTARTQTITEENQPFIFDVLTKYEQLTGLKILINTSFNMHESPIVRTAKDAVQTFIASNLDYLVLGDKLITRRISE